MSQEQMYQLVAIVIYMAVLLAIGWYAYKKTSNLTDYMLGGRSLGPIATALSAGAADMSGWLLMGLPGVIYVTGLGKSWIAIGLVVGAYINWLVVAPLDRLFYSAFTGVKQRLKVQLLVLLSVRLWSLFGRSLSGLAFMKLYQASY